MSTALVGAALVPAGIATADDTITAGADCDGADLNSAVMAPDGRTLRCVADGVHAGFHWEPDGDAVKTLADLENQGFTIQLNKVGNNPLNQCKVASIENYQTSTATDVPDALIQMTRTVTVSLDCG